MVTIGIDPGQKGGIACINGGKLVEAIPMPVNKIAMSLDADKIAYFFKKHQPDTIFLEKVHAIRGSSAKSTFSFGSGFGQLMGITSTLGYRMIQIEPKKWQSLMHEGVEKKYDAKHRSAVAAIRLFPGYDFTLGGKRKLYHDGVVDACLIALAGYWSLAGKP